MKKEAMANIITTSKKIKFNLPVNICKNIDSIDSTLPTLIIGYENAKRNIEGFNILKKVYTKKNIYWTFKRTERGVDYETDLQKFYTTVISDYCDRFSYHLIDFYRVDFNIARKLVSFIKSDEKKLIFNENDRFLYVFCEKYNTVFGFSLATANFFGIRHQKILKLFKNNANNRFVYDFSNIPNELKLIIGEKIDKFMTLYEYFSE